MQSGWFERRPVVLLLIAATLFFWKLSLSGRFTFLESPDLAYQVLPWYQVQARAWHQGVFPLWDPYQWSGQPLLGQMQPGAAFPLNWPLFLAPLEDGSISLGYIHWHYVLMHLLAALFMYALARELGRGKFASLTAGLAFACAGYVGSIGWPQMLHGAIWLPLAVLLFHRIVRAESRGQALLFAALCGGAIGISLLSGHHQTPAFMLFALTGLFVYFFIEKFRASKAQAARFGALFALIALVAFLVAALQLLPAIEYGQQAYRWVDTQAPVSLNDPVPYYAQYDHRLFPLTLIGTVIARAHFQVNTFIGVVLLVFTILGVALSWRDRWVRVYSCLAVVALAYAFGSFSAFHGWVYALVPFADKARSPGHAVYVYQFAGFIVMAFGIDRFFEQERTGELLTRWIAWIRRALVGFAAVTFTLFLYLAMNKTMETNPGDQIMIAVLACLLLAALLVAYRRGAIPPAALRWSLLLLAIFELSATTAYDIVDRGDPLRAKSLPHLTEAAAAMDYLKSQPGPFRFDIANTDFKANLGGWEGVESSGGYLASISRDLYDFMSADWTRGANLTNTVYTLAKDPRQPREGAELVFTAPNGWKVYRNPGASPRAWVVHDAADISPPRGSTAPPPAAEPCGEPQPVAFSSRTMHGSTARATLACQGFVIFAEPDFPGWRATLDGQPAAIYRAHGALRAIAAPAGQHEITFQYRPRSVIIGGALTAFGFLVCLICAALAWRRGDFSPR